MHLQLASALTFCGCVDNSDADDAILTPDGCYTLSVVHYMLNIKPCDTGAERGSVRQKLMVLLRDFQPHLLGRSANSGKNSSVVASWNVCRIRSYRREDS